MSLAELRALAVELRDATKKADVEQLSLLMTEKARNVHLLRSGGLIEVRTCDGQVADRIPISAITASALANSD
jgi:hypothetical protein